MKFTIILALSISNTHRDIRPVSWYIHLAQTRGRARTHARARTHIAIKLVDHKSRGYRHGIDPKFDICALDLANPPSPIISGPHPAALHGSSIQGKCTGTGPPIYSHYLDSFIMSYISQLLGFSPSFRCNWTLRSHQFILTSTTSSDSVGEQHSD